MPRLLLALLLVTLSVWPLLAMPYTYEYEYGSAQQTGSESSEIGDPTGAFYSLDGREVPPSLPIALAECHQHGEDHPLARCGGHLSVASPAAPLPATLVRGGGAILSAGVRLLRYEHLPYFATAPPSPQ